MIKRAYQKLTKYDRHVIINLMGKLYTIKEVAHRLRVSERTIMRYIKAKKIIASKMGQWRIAEKEIESFFKKNSNRHAQ